MEGNVPFNSVSHLPSPRAAPLNKACEVCGCRFATRQGLSSHARLHLRNLGVPLSECTNGPIALLAKLKESKGSSLDFTLDPKDLMALPDPEAKSPKSEKILSTKNSQMGSPSGLKRATPSPLVSSHKTSESGKNNSSAKPATLNPQWAPQETDAPLTLVSNTNDEVHVCQVCGAWYETRKGLSSHARAHLRQLGVSDASTKMSPIALLYKLKKIEPEDRRPAAPQTSAKSSGKYPSLDSPSTSSLASPPSKRPKVLGKFVCVLCGEEFENRKGLGSHARSHLRQIGVSDFLGKSSAVEAIEELARSGMLADIWPMTGDKTASPRTAAKAKAQLSSPSTPPPPHPPRSFSPNTTALSGSGHPSPVNKSPKAKKGYRLAVDPQWKKAKKEPQEAEIPTSVNFIEPTFDGKPIPLILCEYCGQLFDCRKGLSCHVRAHLRQLGIPWTSKSSPIDLLRELMGKEGSGAGAHLSSGRNGSSQKPSFCDLCGFEFQHRKALASHARAHLRQLGVTEWRADGTKGSPIEILSEWVRKEPAKVAEITKRYLLGDLYIKKKANPSPAPPMEAALGAPGSPEPLGLLAGPRAGRELLGSPGESPKAARELSHVGRGHIHKQLTFCDVKGPFQSRIRPQKPQVPSGQENVDGSPQQQNPRPGNIPALLPNPPLTPLVKLVGKVYFLKCRFCEQVFQGPLSVQEDWIAHLQKHILKLGYKGKASPSPALPMTSQGTVDPVAT